MMNDSIDRIPPIRPAGYNIKAAGAIDRNKGHEEHVHDQVSINPDAYKPPEEQKEEISLSVATIRVIAQGNLDPDIEAALTAFAPLGDLSDAESFCDILDARGVEFITWLPGISLRQALEDAAI